MRELNQDELTVATRVRRRRRRHARLRALSARPVSKLPQPCEGLPQPYEGAGRELQGSGRQELRLPKGYRSSHERGNFGRPFLRPSPAFVAAAETDDLREELSNRTQRAISPKRRRPDWNKVLNAGC
jgi:hypothetical protein